MRRYLVLLAALALLSVACPEESYARAPRGNSTAYCLQGRGGWVHAATARVRAEGHLGLVAVPRPGRAGHVPMGTVLVVGNSPWGAGTVVVGDRIGHGSQLDFALPGACGQARAWGRRHVGVRAELPAEGVAREAARA